MPRCRVRHSRCRQVCMTQDVCACDHQQGSKSQAEHIGPRGRRSHQCEADQNHQERWDHLRRKSPQRVESPMRVVREHNRHRHHVCSSPALRLLGLEESAQGMAAEGPCARRYRGHSLGPTLLDAKRETTGLCMHNHLGSTHAHAQRRCQGHSG